MVVQFVQSSPTIYGTNRRIIIPEDGRIILKDTITKQTLHSHTKTTHSLVGTFTSASGLDTKRASWFFLSPTAILRHSLTLLSECLTSFSISPLAHLPIRISILFPPPPTPGMFVFSHNYFSIILRLCNLEQTEASVNGFVPDVYTNVIVYIRLELRECKILVKKGGKCFLKRKFVEMQHLLYVVDSLCVSV